MFKFNDVDEMIQKHTWVCVCVCKTEEWLQLITGKLEVETEEWRGNTGRSDKRWDELEVPKPPQVIGKNYYLVCFLTKLVWLTFPKLEIKI